MPCILQALRQPLSHHTSTYHPFCCFLLLRQKAVPAKVKAPTELYHRNFLFFTRWHEMTIFRKRKAQKDYCGSPFPLFYYFIVYLPLFCTSYNGTNVCLLVIAPDSYPPPGRSAWFLRLRQIRGMDYILISTKDRFPLSFISPQAIS